MGQLVLQTDLAPAPGAAGSDGGGARHGRFVTDPPKSAVHHQAVGGAASDGKAASQRFPVEIAEQSKPGGRPLVRTTGRARTARSTTRKGEAKVLSSPARLPFL